RSFFLTKDQAVLVLAGGGQSSYQSGSVLRMKFRHSNPDAKVSGLDELPGKNNYFIGSDPAKWHSDIPSYAKVKYEELYSGIDLLFYSNQRQLEYDFIIAPGADSSRIGFDVSGAQSVHLDERGAMVFKLGENEVRWQQPLAYQEDNGKKQLVPVRYAITNLHRIGLSVGKYDHDRPLYIDPLIHSTYLGSGTSLGNAIAVDSAGNSYVTGQTLSPRFPVTSGAFQQICPSGTNSCSNAFVTKLNP